MARFNGMPGNANNMMKQLQKMQKQMEEQAKAFESKEFEATAGGGAVRVTVVGAGRSARLPWTRTPWIRTMSRCWRTSSRRRSMRHFAWRRPRTSR